MQLEIENLTRWQCGKTCQASCPCKTTRSGNFWADSLEHTTPSTQAEDGSVRVWQSGQMERLRGECWTLNISESLNDAEECLLSQVLQSSAAPRYYLSARAATGILRRAGKRGQKLPARLVDALLEAAGDADPLSVMVDNREWPKPIAPTLDANFGRRYGQDKQHVAGGCGLFVYVDHRCGDQGADPATPSGVRRLTPVECERLQGFPDGHTDTLSDTQRYKTLGNSMAVPVMRWLGERIQASMNKDV